MQHVLSHVVATFKARQDRGFYALFRVVGKRNVARVPIPWFNSTPLDIHSFRMAEASHWHHRNSFLLFQGAARRSRTCRRPLHRKFPRGYARQFSTSRRQRAIDNTIVSTFHTQLCGFTELIRNPAYNTTLAIMLDEELQTRLLRPAREAL